MKAWVRLSRDEQGMVNSLGPALLPPNLQGGREKLPELTENCCYRRDSPHPHPQQVCGHQQRNVAIAKSVRRVLGE
jgi:hypothetical protein